MSTAARSSRNPPKASAAVIPALSLADVLRECEKAKWTVGPDEVASESEAVRCAEVVRKYPGVLGVIIANQPESQRRCHQDDVSEEQYPQHRFKRGLATMGGDERRRRTGHT
jgi:hypothetical protein